MLISTLSSQPSSVCFTMVLFSVLILTFHQITPFTCAMKTMNSSFENDQQRQIINNSDDNNCITGVSSSSNGEEKTCNGYGIVENTENNKNYEDKKGEKIVEKLMMETGSMENLSVRYGMRQLMHNKEDAIIKVFDYMIEYMEFNIHRNPSFKASPTSNELPRPCRNIEEDCVYWASVGECTKNPKFMIQKCAPACQFCEEWLSEQPPPTTIEDVMDSGYIDYFERYGVSQKHLPMKGEKEEKILFDMVEYMEKVVYQEPKYMGTIERCKNEHELCILWGMQGECEKNSGYMRTSCAPVCQSCEEFDINLKCPLDLNPELNTWKSGDLNRMFLRIITDETLTTNLTIYSMPFNVTPPATTSLLQQKQDQMQPAPPQILDGPWVITISNFLSDEECDGLIKLGQEFGYETSFQAGKTNFDGSSERVTTKYRTSSNTWCTDKCYDSEVNQAVVHRIQDLIDVPIINYEHLQLLQYYPGQYYNRHHDLIDHHINRQQGVRILTVFIYLSDVIAGGGTNFPLLNDLTVQPKKGSVLIWPSVHDEHPHTADLRTEHAAMPVEEGTKYAANAWVHQRNFIDTFENSCHS